MTSFTDTFKRKEVKYRLSDRQYRFILAQVQKHMELDLYGRARITSLYFDTPQRDLIARSLEKPLYKEKLRVRWYGQADARARVYVEIKKKFKGIVYKRRVGMSRDAAAALLMNNMPYGKAVSLFPLDDELQQRETTNARSLQIAAEIEQFMQVHAPLHPSMYIQCERCAYASKPAQTLEEEESASDLRITFDSGIAYRDCFAEAQGASRIYRPLMAPGEVVMEVKTSAAFPFWLVNVLNECEAYPSSFSKYGTAYQTVMGHFAANRQLGAKHMKKETCCA